MEFWHQEGNVFGTCLDLFGQNAIFQSNLPYVFKMDKYEGSHGVVPD